jgi:hypothetical protein
VQREAVDAVSKGVPGACQAPAAANNFDETLDTPSGLGASLEALLKALQKLMGEARSQIPPGRPLLNVRRCTRLFVD